MVLHSRILDVKFPQIEAFSVELNERLPGNVITLLRGLGFRTCHLLPFCKRVSMYSTTWKPLAFRVARHVAGDAKSRLNHKLKKSGRHDSNVRPPAPKAGALARLSYAPIHIGETTTPTKRYVGKDASVIPSMIEECVR